MLQPEIYLIGGLSAFFTLFMNYCIGRPASEKFSPYEIFSFYTVWLSVRRLKEVGLYIQYKDQYNQNLVLAKTKHQRITLDNEFKKMLYDAADPFFTWERAVGMCPVCTGFWIALITFGVSILPDPTFEWIKILHLVIIVLVSHITIRILNKIL